MLYTGLTSELFFRIKEHKEKFYPKSFSAKYNCDVLVYYKQFSSIEEAIAKEKQVNNWQRAWKINLVNTINPSWKDLFDELE